MHQGGYHLSNNHISHTKPKQPVFVCLQLGKTGGIKRLTNRVTAHDVTRRSGGIAQDAVSCTQKPEFGLGGYDT